MDQDDAAAPPYVSPTYGSPQRHMEQHQMDQLFQAVSNILLQVNHTNQALLNFLSTGQHQHRSDPKVRPKSFSGLPSEDVLMWLDHLENVAGYHLWTDDRKAMEVRTLLDNVAATWYI